MKINKIFTTAQVVHITARITFIHVFIRSSNIWLSYILNRLFITSRVYLEPTSWPAQDHFHSQA